jgi:hypothetical protein
MNVADTVLEIVEIELQPHWRCEKRPRPHKCRGLGPQPCNSNALGYNSGNSFSACMWLA